MSVDEGKYHKLICQTCDPVILLNVTNNTCLLVSFQVGVVARGEGRVWGAPTANVQVSPTFFRLRGGSVIYFELFSAPKYFIPAVLCSIIKSQINTFTTFTAQWFVKNQQTNFNVRQTKAQSLLTLRASLFLLLVCTMMVHIKNPITIH